MAEGVDDSGEFGLPEWLLRKPGDGSAPPTNASPTIGARMAGGAAVPAPATPANPAPAMPSVAFDPSKLPDALRPPTPSPASVPAQPMTPTTAPPVPPKTGSDNPVLAQLLAQQAAIGKPIDPNAKDANGKSLYKMGTGSRVLGTVGNFLQGFGGRKFTPVYTGPGATNSRFARDEELREGNLANVGTQVAGQKELDTEDEQRFRDVTSADTREETAKASTMRAEAAQQLADAKEVANSNVAKYNEEKTNTALRALEEKARRDEQMHTLGMDVLQARKDNAELSLQLQQQKLENDKAKYATGTDAKSLEAERKERIASAMANRKNNPNISKLQELFGGKTLEQEIKVINDDVNSRLSGAGVNTGAPPSPQSPKPAAAPQSKPAKGYTRIKASDGNLHDIPSGKLNAAKARDPKLVVVQ